MPPRYERPSVGEYYHVFNRGVEKRVTFCDNRDYRRFLEIVEYYLQPKPPISFSQRDRLRRPKPHIQHRVLDMRFDDKENEQPLIEIVAYCLMPNHFHFLVRVVSEGGLENWIRRVINSYTRSFNVRWGRIGPLFQGPYKLVHVRSNNQLVHLSRYLHLNSVVAKLSLQAKDWKWSSMGYYLDSRQASWIKSNVISQQFTSPAMYQAFVDDHAGYAMEIASMKKMLIDGEE